VIGAHIALLLARDWRHDVDWVGISFRAAKELRIGSAEVGHELLGYLVYGR